MKRIVLLSFACIFLAACAQTIDKPFHFEKGQKMTLTVNSVNTKVSSTIGSSSIDFNWQTGDKIKVTVGGSSAEFVLKSGDGTASATFEGTMPASGESFDVQYPLEEPDITNQTGVGAGCLPTVNGNCAMLFKATGCSSDVNIELKPQYAIIDLCIASEKSYKNLISIYFRQFSNDDKKYSLTFSKPVDCSLKKDIYFLIPECNCTYAIDIYFDTMYIDDALGLNVGDYFSFEAGKIYYKSVYYERY